MGVGGGTTYPQASLIIPTHLYRRGEIGEFLLPSKQIDFKPRIDFKRLQFIFCRHPLVGPATLLRIGHDWQIAVVNWAGDIFAGGKIPDSAVPVGGHDFKIAHGWEKVQVAVGLATTARVIKRIERPVTAKKLSVLILDHLSEFLGNRRRILLEKSAIHQLGKQLVSSIIEMRAVDGEIGAWTFHRGEGSLKNINETDLKFTRNTPHDVCIGFKVSIVQCCSINTLNLFVCNW